MCSCVWVSSCLILLQNGFSFWKPARGESYSAAARDVVCGSRFEELTKDFAILRSSINGSDLLIYFYGKTRPIGFTKVPLRLRGEDFNEMSGTSIPTWMAAG